MNVNKLLWQLRRRIRITYPGISGISSEELAARDGIEMTLQNQFVIMEALVELLSRPYKTALVGEAIMGSVTEPPVLPAADPESSSG